MANHWDPDASSAGELSKIAITRITKELGEITKSPPCGIRVIVGDSVQLCYAIITGPSDTSYTRAPFLIKIIFPSDYPFSAPKCKLLTTGGGTVRFGPNLYACGKICLSILGTWDGPGWAPNLSLSAVLVSIQSLMSKDAAQNEPGHESAPKHEIVGLNNVLRHEVLRVAVLDQMKSVLCKKFYDDDICEAMLEHFQSSIESHIDNAKKYIHLDGNHFSEPYYARVTDSGRIFRFKLLADQMEEQSKLLKQDVVPDASGGVSIAQLPILPASPTASD
jgi:ubiquitin-conjugating enzyme E2 Z